MVSRSELVEIVSGAGRLEIRGTTSASGLFVDGCPVAANWSDCGGSIGQHFYRVADCSLEQNMAHAREAVRDVPAPDQPLSGRFWPLLSQFASGKYRLDYDEDGAGVRLREVSYPSGRQARDYIQHYAVQHWPEHALLPTQSADCLDQDRIQEWAIAIEAGERPTVITTMLDGADTEFILDGHHKLAAYELAGRAPRRLAIVCLEARLLQLSDWPGKGAVTPSPSWPKALALRELRWPHDAEQNDRGFEYKRRVDVAKRLGVPPPNLVGFLEASHATISEYSADFRHKAPRGWIMSPARLELLDPGVAVGSDGGDIVKVAVINSRSSSAADLVGWVPLIATTFSEYYDATTRTIVFRHPNSN